MEELVEVAFVADEPQAEMVRGLLRERGIPSLQQQVGPSGPQLGKGLLNPGGGSRRVMVHPQRAEEARAALAEAAAIEDIPDPVNAEYLADAQGRRPRSYGLIGGLARALLVSFGVLALTFGIFTLVNALT
jgi:putative signal transducing protein